MRPDRLDASPRFTQAFSWTELGPLASLADPPCVPLTACTNTMKRTVYNAYQGGRLVAVHPYYATEITYHPNGMRKQVTHARRGEQVSAGSAERIDADPNAMGRPYRISIGGTTTFNLRGLDGALRREYIYRDGLLLASQHRSEGHQHYALSHLGTTRMLTNRCGERVKRYDLFPYGADTISAPANDTETRRFTGHQRDLGSPTNTTDDLEYMYARYYGVKMGRLLSVDVGGRARTPMRWNRYAYVSGNPMRRVNPDGAEEAEVAIPIWQRETIRDYYNQAEPELGDVLAEQHDRSMEVGRVAGLTALATGFAPELYSFFITPRGADTLANLSELLLGPPGPGTSTPRVVLGESMPRVGSAASPLGASTFSTAWTTEAEVMAKNMNWLETMISKGPPYWTSVSTPPGRRLASSTPLKGSY